MLSKKIWIALIIIIIAAGGGYYYYNNVYLPSQVTEEPAIQTSKVRTGDITVSANGAGTVIPATEIDLGFRAGGTLADVTVQVGDKVQAGNLLAQLDDTDARKAVALAEIQVAQAALQGNPNALIEGLTTNEIAVSQAEINLISAQTKLDELLNWQPDADTLALAELRQSSSGSV